MSHTPAITPAQFTTFGDLLKFLRRRAGLSQTELSIGVGYSAAQISRLEKNLRAPDTAAIAARFVPELDLEMEPVWVARLLELAAVARAENEPEASESHVPSVRHNLPLQFTSFVGRDQEIAELKRLLAPNATAAQEVRLLTLSGTGGSGKTRLALRAATECLGEFPDGVFFINLAPLSEPGLVLPTILQTLGVSPIGRQTALDALQEQLRTKRLLLVLDNFEQMLDAAPDFATLLTKTSHLKILVTSRVLLHLASEHEFRVPPMPLPNLRPEFANELEQNEAVALFVERAQAARAGFQLTPTTARVVAEICVRLDGLPLAIELAAARIRILAPQDLLTRLGRRLHLLTGGARDLPARQQTLRNAIDWSFQLLTPNEQRLFTRLGVFVGGWTLESAEQVCFAGADRSDDSVDEMQTLAEHNLIQHQASPEGDVRLTMLETLREFALEQLEASGELESLRQRHADYFFAFVDEAIPTDGNLATPKSVERILEEHANLRAASAWNYGSKGNAQKGLRLAETIGYAANWTEERIWMDRALAYADTEGGYDPHTRGRVLRLFGLAQAWQGDNAGAESSFFAALAIFRQLEDRTSTLHCMERLGWLARERGDAATAIARLEETISLANELDLSDSALGIKITLASAITMQGDIAAARRLLEQVLPQLRQRGDSVGVGWALNHLGHVAQLESDYEQATRLYTESLSLFPRDNPHWTSHIEGLQSLGETALAQGDAALATVRLYESLALAQKYHLAHGIAWCLAGLAGVAVLNEEPENAAYLWGAAEHLRQRLGVREGPATHAVHKRLRAKAGEQLGEQAFDAAWAKGEQTPIEDIVKEILST